MPEIFPHLDFLIGGLAKVFCSNSYIGCPLFQVHCRLNQPSFFGCRLSLDVLVQKVV
jgi:hypothetical protein